MNPFINSTAYKSLGLLKTRTATHTRKHCLQNTKRAPDLRDTPTGRFDGSALSNGTQSEARGLIKITNYTSYRWTFICGLGTNSRAELLDAWATLYLASRLHINTLQIYGDSRIIIE